MRQIHTVLEDMGWPDQLLELAQRIRANVPRRNDPEAFHAEKDDIANQLRRIAREASNHLSGR